MFPNMKVPCGACGAEAYEDCLPDCLGKTFAEDQEQKHERWLVELCFSEGHTEQEVMNYLDNVLDFKELDGYVMTGKRFDIRRFFE